MIREDVKYFSNHSSTVFDDPARYILTLEYVLLFLLLLLPCDSSCARSIEERKCLRSLAQDTESRFYRFLSPFSRTSRVEQCYYNGVKRDGQQQRVTGSSSAIPPFELLELYDLGGCTDTRDKLALKGKLNRVLSPSHIITRQYFQTLRVIVKLNFFSFNLIENIPRNISSNSMDTKKSPNPPTEKKKRKKILFLIEEEREEEKDKALDLIASRIHRGFSKLSFPAG